LLYGRRCATSVNPGLLGCSIAEGMHRTHDVVNGRLDPFHTVVRGVEEELSPIVARTLHDPEVILLGCSFSLENFHPYLIFLLRAPLTQDEVVAKCRENPGIDYREREPHLRWTHHAEASEWETLLGRGDWDAGCRAAMMRVLEFLRS